MGIFAAYTIALLCTTIFVVRRGDRIARWSITGIWVGFIAATWATLAIANDDAYLKTILSIELTSLIFKIYMTNLSNRRWPIIIAGLQINVVCGQISLLISSSYFAKVLYFASTLWAIPVLLVISLGLYMDNRWDIRSRAKGQQKPNNA